MQSLKDMIAFGTEVFLKRELEIDEVNCKKEERPIIPSPGVRGQGRGEEWRRAAS